MWTNKSRDHQHREDSVSNCLQQEVKKRKRTNHGQHIKGVSDQPNHKCDCKSYDSIESSRHYAEGVMKAARLGRGREHYGPALQISKEFPQRVEPHYPRDLV